MSYSYAQTKKVNLPLHLRMIGMFMRYNRMNQFGKKEKFYYKLL